LSLFRTFVFLHISIHLLFYHRMTKTLCTY
jgi:hypothetical protein